MADVKDAKKTISANAAPPRGSSASSSTHVDNGWKASAEYLKTIDFKKAIPAAEIPDIEKALDAVLDYYKTTTEFHKAMVADKKKVYDYRKVPGKRCVTCGGWVGSKTKECPVDGKEIYYVESIAKGKSSTKPKTSYTATQYNEVEAKAKLERKRRIELEQRIELITKGKGIYDKFVDDLGSKDQVVSSFVAVWNLYQASGSFKNAWTLLNFQSANIPELEGNEPPVAKSVEKVDQADDVEEEDE